MPTIKALGEAHKQSLFLTLTIKHSFFSQLFDS